MGNQSFGELMVAADGAQETESVNVAWESSFGELMVAADSA